MDYSITGQHLHRTRKCCRHWCRRLVAAWMPRYGISRV